MGFRNFLNPDFFQGSVGFEKGIEKSSFYHRMCPHYGQALIKKTPKISVFRGFLTTQRKLPYCNCLYCNELAIFPRETPGIQPGVSKLPLKFLSHYNTVFLFMEGFYCKPGILIFPRPHRPHEGKRGFEQQVRGVREVCGKNS
jgi:hypothetical protein